MTLGVALRGTWSPMRQEELVVNPAESVTQWGQAFKVGEHSMSEVSTERQLLAHHRIAELEQQLLALGSMPRIDEELWNADQWARYAVIVRELRARLSSSAMDQAECAHCS